MDIGDALLSHLSDMPHEDEIHTFRDAIDYLVDRAGSASMAARVIGVAPSTMRHWVSSGRVPSAERRADVIEAASLQQRRDNLSPERERQLRYGTPARMVGRLTYDSSPEPDRVFDFYNYLEDGVGDALVDAYLDGADALELAQIFHEHLGDDGFYEETIDPYYDGHIGYDIDGIEGW